MRQIIKGVESENCTLSGNYPVGKEIYLVLSVPHFFPQTWTDNMNKAGQMTLKSFDDEDFTCITFQPDLAKFKMTTLDKDIVALMTRRAYDMAGAVKDVKVFLNGKRLPVSEHLLMFPLLFLERRVKIQHEVEGVGGLSAEPNFSRRELSTYPFYRSKDSVAT